MLPNKLQHGDSLARLFDLWNQLIDYLREIRLVAGPGIRINRLPAGTTIESTAAAPGGVSAPAAEKGHPFDAEIINKGTEENPNYYVRIFNSSVKDSPYAGIIYAGDWDVFVPVTELPVSSSNEFYINLTVEHYSAADPPFTVNLSLQHYGSSYHYRANTFQLVIAEGKLPEISSLQNANILIEGRWV